MALLWTDQTDMDVYPEPELDLSRWCRNPDTHNRCGDPQCGCPCHEEERNYV